MQKKSCNFLVVPNSGSSSLVEDTLPFPGSKLSCYSFIYLQDKEFFQVHVLYALKHQNLLEFLDFQNLFKNKNNFRKKVKLSFSLKAVLWRGAHTLAVTNIGFLMLFVPPLKKETAVAGPQQAAVAQNNFVVGPRHSQLGQLKKPVGGSRVLSKSSNNDCPKPLNEVLQRFGLDSEQVWQELKNVNHCQNPDKKGIKPPDFLTPFLKQKGIDKSSFSLTTISQEFVDEFSSVVESKHTSRYPQGFRAASPVFDSRGKMIQSAKERKAAQVKEAVIFSLADGTQKSLPVKIFQELGEAMHDVLTGRITEKEEDVVVENFLQEIQQLDQTTVPLLQYFPKDKENVAYTSYMKGCVEGELDPTIQSGEFFQKENAHFLGRDPCHGLDISANQGTSSNQQHAVATEGESKLGLPGARSGGGLPMLKGALHNNEQLQVIRAEGNAVTLRASNTKFVNTTLKLVRETDFSSPGGVFEVHGYLKLLQKQETIDSSFVNFNKKAIAETAGKLGRYYGGGFGVFMGISANPDSSSNQLKTYFVAGSLLGQEVFTEAATKTYSNRVAQLTENLAQQNSKLRHISQIQYPGDRFS